MEFVRIANDVYDYILIAYFIIHTCIHFYTNAGGYVKYVFYRMRKRMGRNKPSENSREIIAIQDDA